MQLMRVNCGFTLVEMVVVIAVLGVLSLGSVYFISRSSEGYADVQDRQVVAQRARFTLERMARSVRNALPGSVRVSAGCLEFVPLVAGSSYLDLPLATPAMTMRVVPPDAASLNGMRVAVAGGGDVYTLATSSVISSPVTLTAPDAQGEVTVAFAGAHQFPAASAGSRLFWVDEPVSYCVDGGNLYRYSNYGFQVTQPTPASLPTTLPGRSLMATTASAVFNLSPATLQRNALVQLNLQLGVGDVAFDVAANVQVRNVP